MLHEKLKVQDYYQKDKSRCYKSLNSENLCPKITLHKDFETTLFESTLQGHETKLDATISLLGK